MSPMQVEPSGGPVQESMGQVKSMVKTLVFLLAFFAITIIVLVIIIVVMQVSANEEIDELQDQLEEVELLVNPTNPPLPGVMASEDGIPHIILALDVNYPPYAKLDKDDYTVAGFNVDVAKEMESVCDIKFTIS